MAVTVKTKREIELMREANHRLEKVFDALGSMIRPGISTWDIDQAARELISEQGGIPNFLNYDGFPGAICTSVNEEVVHGIPVRIYAEDVLRGELAGPDGRVARQRDLRRRAVEPHRVPAVQQHRRPVWEDMEHAL